MKKFNLLLLSFLASMLIFTSCSNDDDSTPAVDPDATVFDRTATDVTNPTRPAVRITDNGQGVGNYTFSADTTYILDNFVFVSSGQTLTIEAGAVIKGEAGAGANASALIVARGGSIVANGTESSPIIMTTLDDNINSVDPDVDGLTPQTRGRWGGLIVLGNATTNWEDGTEQIEGIPTTESRGQYGGTDDTDNSGTIRYVSVRHGGTEIGSGNEINGITFGGVGSGTTVEFTEVFANLDDGYEWFGGTVNGKWLISAFCGDEMFDWDAGFRGGVQFLYGIHEAGDGDFYFECNGVDSGRPASVQGNTPRSLPIIANGTFIKESGNSQNTLRIRDGSGGFFYNNIFFSPASGKLEIDSDATNTEASGKRITENELVFMNTYFYGTSSSLTGLVEGDQDDNAANMLNGTVMGNDSDGNATSTTNPFTAVTFGDDLDATTQINPILDITSPSPNFIFPTTAPTTAVNSITTGLTYIGAFGTDNWADTWTALTAYGIF